MDFITNYAAQCWAFSRALKIEMLKAPLFRGSKGAGDAKDRCIIVYANSEGSDWAKHRRNLTKAITTHIKCLLN